MKEEMDSQMDSAEEATTEIADIEITNTKISDSTEEQEEVVIEDSAEPKELGKKLDVTTIEDALDTTTQYWTPTEVRVATRYKELRNHDINKAETYLIDQIRSGFVSRKFDPLEVKA
jgi:hypothetical protein